MNSIAQVFQKVSSPFLRLSLAVVLLWIGALKFADPAPVVGLLQSSFAFLASSAVVYVLGGLEVIAGLLLLMNWKVEYVGALCVALFTGTLAIFIIAPKVTYGDAGFPYLSLPGEFLLKDLVLMAASTAVASLGSSRGAHAAMTARLSH